MLLASTAPMLMMAMVVHLPYVRFLVWIFAVENKKRDIAGMFCDDSKITQNTRTRPTASTASAVAATVKQHLFRQREEWTFIIIYHIVNGRHTKLRLNKHRSTRQLQLQWFSCELLMIFQLVRFFRFSLFCRCSFLLLFSLSRSLSFLLSLGLSLPLAATRWAMARRWNSLENILPQSKYGLNS